MLSVLLDMFKANNKGKFKGMYFELINAAQKTFNKLKIVFISIPMLIHFNPK